MEIVQMKIGNHKKLKILDFQDAIRLFYGNTDVGSFNYEQLLKLTHPIAHIQAQYSSGFSKTIKQLNIS